MPGVGLTRLFRGTCYVTIEVAGPVAFYDPQKTNVPFTISASPYQLGGLAAYVIEECVVKRGYIGGFASNKVQNLLDYVRRPDFDPKSSYRKKLRESAFNIVLWLTREIDSGIRKLSHRICKQQKRAISRKFRPFVRHISCRQHSKLDEICKAWRSS